GFNRRLHRIRILFQIGIAEEIGGAPCGYNQIVVKEAANLSDHFLSLQINGLHFGYPDMNIFLTLKNLSQGKRDGTWLQSRCRNLVKKRLKLMEIVLVNQCDVIII